MEVDSDIAGEQYSLVCVVTVVGGLPTAFWQHNGENFTNGVASSGQGTTTVTLTLDFNPQFNPLTYEDGGNYTCVGFSAVSNPNTTSLSFLVDVQGKQVALLHCFIKKYGSTSYLRIAKVLFIRNLAAYSIR